VPRLLHELGFSVQRPAAPGARLDGTLHRTSARIGVQPRVDTFGMRKTAQIFGALSLERRPRVQYPFAPVFNAQTFLAFLQFLVRRTRRKIPCPRDSV